jgi:hypothetical protein
MRNFPHGITVPFRANSTINKFCILTLTAERCDLSACPPKARDESGNRRFFDSIAPMCKSGAVETSLARRSDNTDAPYPQARKAPTRSIFKRAHVRQPRTTAVNPACGCSRDRNEEQDSGRRRSSVERNKEGDGFVRFRWGETKEQDAVAGARLTIEIGADFPIGIKPCYSIVATQVGPRK